MTQGYGKISKDNAVIIDNIPITYHYNSIDLKSTLPEWHGSFKLKNIHIDISPANNPYKLILEDGKSGMINITHLRTDSSGRVSINFQGTGPLE